MTKYRTIVADPPWSYADQPPPRFTGLDVPPSKVLPYQTLSVAEIVDLPVCDLADNDAHLYLWTTQRFLSDAFDVVSAWGFRYSCTLVWCKNPIPFNYGGAFKSTLEFVLFARKGNLPASERVDRQWFNWPRQGHSQKPEAFLDLVEQVSPSPRLELFARRARFGWDYWGDESLQTVELAS